MNERGKKRGEEEKEGNEQEEKFDNIIPLALHILSGIFAIVNWFALILCNTDMYNLRT